jgi:hypothetical protein
MRVLNNSGRVLARGSHELSARIFSRCSSSAGALMGVAGADDAKAPSLIGLPAVRTGFGPAP